MQRPDRHPYSRMLAACLLPFLVPSVALLLSPACAAEDPGPGTNLDGQYSAELVIRDVGDGTMHASADILDEHGCTVEVVGPVEVNGHEMIGGFSAGVDDCVQSRYVYQAAGLDTGERFELTVAGHVLAIVELE